MAKKKIEVQTLQSVKFEGKYQPIGARLKLDQDEAERLIALGAVEIPRPKIDPAAGAGDEGKGGAPKSAELIEQIKAATTLEEVQALVPEGETRTTVLDAASARWEELEKAQS